MKISDMTKEQLHEALDNAVFNMISFEDRLDMLTALKKIEDEEAETPEK